MIPREDEPCLVFGLPIIAAKFAGKQFSSLPRVKPIVARREPPSTALSPCRTRNARGLRLVNFKRPRLRRATCSLPRGRKAGKDQGLIRDRRSAPKAPDILGGGGVK
jgi:hypothetical protein